MEKPIPISLGTGGVHAQSWWRAPQKVLEANYNINEPQRQLEMAACCKISWNTLWIPCVPWGGDNPKIQGNDPLLRECTWLQFCDHSLFLICYKHNPCFKQTRKWVNFPLDFWVVSWIFFQLLFVLIKVMRLAVRETIEIPQKVTANYLLITFCVQSQRVTH